MTKRLIALLGALVVLLTFFTACGNGGSTQQQPDDKPKQDNVPQLTVAMNPVLVFDGSTTVIPYNDMNKVMAADSQSSTLSAIADSAWGWVHASDDGWTRRAVYNFGRWQNGAAVKAKGAFAYAYNDAASISLGVYNTKSVELATYQDEEIPATGVLLSAVAGTEEALYYTVPQDGTLTIPAGSVTAIEQVAGVKTGFLAEDGTARSASMRILVNGKQMFSGTLTNSTAAEDGVAVTQLNYPQLEDIQVKAGDMVFIALKLDAQANTDEDVSAPTVNEANNWKEVTHTYTVKIEDTGDKVESDITSDDGSIPMILDYQFTFTLLREDKYIEMVNEFTTTVMKRTAAEVFVGHEETEAKYELIIGEYSARPESTKIYNELKSARADNADDYIIRLVGTKVYIVGANDQALQKALNYFRDTFVPDDSGKIPAKYNYYNKPDHVVYTVGGQNVAAYTIRTEHYPSLIVQRAAEGIQKAVLANCGYLLPIVPMNYDGTDAGNNEFRVGPMNGAVKVDRQYDTRFKSNNWQDFMTIDTDGMLTGVDDGYYELKWSGKNIVIQGASSYAVSVATAQMIAELTKTKKLDTNYKISGVYESGYDYKLMKGYKTVDYSMVDGFGFIYGDDFDYEGTDQEKDKAVRKKWVISKDSTDSTRQDGDDKMYQYRPGVYGDNWWVAADTAGNNYLFEITKKRTLEYEGSDHGWDSGRLVSAGFWGFRYGIWETRLVMGTRNGACSAVWGTTNNPYSSNGPWHEIDVYENYGRDVFVPCLHYSVGTEYKGNYHFQAPYYQEACWLEPNEGEHFYDTFHHVTVDWTYDYLNIYFDGECVSAMPMFNNEDFKYFRNGCDVKLANGIGTRGYCWTAPKDFVGERKSYNVYYWMGEENIHKFFEVQLVDYTNIYQTSNLDENGQVKENMKGQRANDIQFTASFDRS